MLIDFLKITTLSLTIQTVATIIILVTMERFLGTYACPFIAVKQ